jgi:DNA repair exonuclease SbcCD ATPase subunit
MKLEAENIGPVKRLEIEVKPGLNVLRGAQGSGKSTVLRAVNYALTKSGDKPTPRDGTRAGKLSFGGITATFTSKATLKGTLEVESLSGRLDIGDLIRPGYEDEAVNDKHRIRRLLELANVQATPEMFVECGFNLEASVLPSDLIDAADAVKVYQFEKAREQEAAAAKAKANADAARRNVDGVNMRAECDPSKLQEAYTEAHAGLVRLEQQKKAADERIKVAADARKQIEAAKSSCLLTSKAALTAVEDARANLRRSQQEVDSLRDLLEQAVVKRNAATEKLEACEQQFNQADDYERAMAKWESQVAAAEQVKPVAQLQIEEAKEEVHLARQAIEIGAIVRKAREQLAAADDFDEAHAVAVAAAERYRANAARTEDVLAAQLEAIGCPWRPIDLPKGSGTVRRLVTNHKRGEQTLVSELSEGERAKHAIDVALRLAGPSDRPAVLILRQEVFEGLQPKVRAEIDKHASERGVVILTANVSDDDEVTA